MTKHPEPNGKTVRGGPVVSEKSGQTFEAVPHTVLQTPQRVQDGHSFKGLSLAECYVKGILNIILKYDFGTRPGDAGAINKSAVYQLCYDSTVGVDNFGVRDECVAAHWQDALMLVSDIELMEVPQIVLPSNVRLNLVKNVKESRLGGAMPVFYMSANGVLHPFSVFTDRKLAPRVDGMLVCFDQNAVCVVKGSPQIMDGVTKNGWRMTTRLSEANASPLFQCALLMLGAKSFSVFRDVSVEKPFKLVDVLVGPFYLE